MSKLKVGNKIRLHDQVFTVIQKLGRLGYRITNEGFTFRLKCNQVKDVEVLP